MNINEQFNEKVLLLMLEIYCKKKHENQTSETICKTCSDLLEYSLMRLKKCPKLPKKPICYKCKISCYAKEKKNLIREVMRYSGPRVFVSHPIMTINFLIKKIF